MCWADFWWQWFPVQLFTPAISIWNGEKRKRKLNIFKNFATKLLAVALGGVIYYIVLQIVIWLGVDTNLLKLFQALVVAIFLAVPYWKGRYFNKPKKIGETAKEDE